MAGDFTASVQINGDAGAAISELKKLTDTVKGATDQIGANFSSLKDAAGMVTGAMAGIGAALAGGAMFKAAIDATKAWEGSAVGLGKALNISATQASVYETAIETVGGTTDDISAAMQGLTRQIRTHEDALNQMGLKTRDANGNLRNMNDIMMDAIGVVNSYQAGADRNIAAQTLFGRGVSAGSAALKLNSDVMKEAAQDAEDLGLAVGQRSVDAYKENKHAMEEAGLVMTGMQKAIGDALMPVLTSLAEWFRSIGPAAITVIKGALGGIISLFWALVAAVNITMDVWNTLAHVFIETLGHMGSILNKFVHGDFKGAWAEAGDAFHDVAKNIRQGFNDIVDDGKAAASKIANLFTNDDQEAKKPAGGSKRMGETKPQRNPDDRFAEWKVALDKIKDAEGQFRAHDIAADIEYWQQKLSAVTGNSEADKKLRTKIEEQILADKRKLQAEDLKLDEEAALQRRNIALAEVETRKQAIIDQFDAGEISKLQELAGLRQLEEQKYQIELQGLQERLKLVEFDRVEKQKAMDAIELLEKQHGADMLKIDRDAIRERMKPWNDFFKSINKGFEDSIAGMIRGTTTLAGAMRNLFQSILQTLAQTVAKMVADWATGEIKKTVLTQSYTGIRTALVKMGLLEETTAQTAASATTTSTKATEATAVISSNAGEAASGAAASASSIPYIGWILAGVAFAEVLSMVMGAKGNVKSAAGGYDIPSGVNPMAQLHADEMVLPAKYADVIRGMADDNGGGSGAGAVHLHVHALDAKDVKKYFQNNAHVLAPALQRIRRNMVPVSI